MALQEIVDEAFQQAEISTTDAGLKEEFLRSLFMDVFEIGMYPALTGTHGRLYSNLTLSSGYNNIESFIGKNSLDFGEKILRAAENVRDYILDNCQELTFKAMLADPSPSIRKRVSRFHESWNRGKDRRRKRVDYYAALLTAWVTGGIPAAITTGLGYIESIGKSAAYNMIQQHNLWFVGALLGVLAIPHFRAVFESPRREWPRERENLGRELGIQDEFVLDPRYDEFKPAEGTYSGQYNTYVLTPKNGRSLRLKDLHEINRGRPLFELEFFETNIDSPLIWVAGVEVKVDGIKYPLERVRAWDYIGGETIRKPAEFVDEKFFKAVHDVRR